MPNIELKGEYVVSMLVFCVIMATSLITSLTVSSLCAALS